MSIPAIQRRAPSAGNLWATLQTDPIAGLTLGIFVAFAVLYAVPILPAEHLAFLTRRLGPFLFLSLVVAALRSNLARIKATEDREFWNDLLRAFICWWLTAALILFFPSPESKPLGLDLTTSVLHALYYVSVLMAIERQPHRRHRWRPIELERSLSWSTVTAVMLGFLLYFPIIALWTDREAYSSGIPDLFFHLTLDGFISIRLVYLCRIVQSPRWRLIYALLGAAAVTILVNDVAEALALATEQRLWRWDALGNVALYLPYLLVVAAARLRHHPFPWEPPPPASKIRIDENLPGPLGQTMIFILLFPLIHFGGYALGVLDEASRPWREVLVLVWLPILGIIAAVQYRLLDRTLKELKEERQRSEHALHKTQKELRLAQERQLTDEALRASDARFGKAFRACPDVMAISRLEDGYVLDVNDSCRRVFGYTPEEVLGHTAHELGLWPDSESRRRMVEELMRLGQVTREVEFRNKSCEPRSGIFSARLIDIEGRPHLFAVTRDLTEKMQHEKDLKRRVCALEESPVWAVDEEGRIVFWSDEAEHRFGHRADDVTGRSEAGLQLPREPALRIPVSAAGGEPDRWLIVAPHIP